MVICVSVRGESHPQVGMIVVICRGVLITEVSCSQVS
ncbi:hypothetical protein GBAR_LOCUS29082 [Geodia barretti]|uniref:Uncharacterized protein n=1 Tax=Geodia barretti TaxID=519541 RepID=A0AA35TSX2_GEOBA|nr:hypothetical protein GBAR_LOCUS29082 [Geodia barretti]